MLKRVPIAILVGVVLGLLAAALRVVGTPAGEDLTDFFRWQLVRGALSTAEDVLVTAGLFALARRTSGRARQAVRLAGWLSLGVLVWYAASPAVDVVVGGKPWALAFYRWTSCVASLAMLGVAGALIVAARGGQRAVLASAMSVGAILARGVVPPVVEALHAYFRVHPDLGAAHWFVTSVLFAVGVVWLVATIANDSVDPVPEHARAAAGFRLAAGALKFRLVVAVVLAVMSIGMLRTASLIELVTLVGPALVIGTMVAVALGFVAAAHAAVDGLPPLRLAIGAALTLWLAGVQLVQLSWLYEAMHSEYSYFREHPEIVTSWSILGPLVATAGFALVGTAISAFAGARGDDDLRESARVRTLLAVVLFGSSVWIQAEIWKARTPDGRMMLIVIAAGAGIGALVAIMGLLRHAAAALEAGPSLPAARVVDGG